ncbi:hypothetical protein [Sphingomonas sp. EC-HK361]|uniref:hypothetical protein n=1 Tax=Sphingomonas sp. EC-HK361 TaxID=2038397 RepID=UPI001F346DCD|nr:hypothetical protein [Sphingomonas sp. EC-HK361]
MAALAFVGAGALAQKQDQKQEKPESLLPPGFGEQAPTQAPDQPGLSPQQQPPQTVPAAPGTVAPALVNGVAPDILPSPTPTVSPTPIDPATLAKYEMPEFARRSLTTVGTGGGGFGADAFGQADGGYLETLMRRLSAPVPSRWVSIALRRLLTAPIATPAQLNGADFAAERAWLLLRMGESVSARSVVEAVDNDNYTPKLRQVAMQAMLATADPAGLCPLANASTAAFNERGWVLAKAMCTSLSGDAAAARPLIAAAKRQRLATGIDMQLAEKVAGAGADSRQAVTIEWNAVDQLTAWRFGLAAATGVAIPDTLYASVGPQVTGWRALSPAIPMADRVGVAGQAATMGVLSSAALVDLYAALDTADDTPAPIAALASDIQNAYVGADAATRAKALVNLWDGATTPADRYARLILTARAAARVRPGDNPEANRLVAAMLTAGLDRLASRWRNSVNEGSDGWALITLADPDFAGRVSYRTLSGYAGSGDAALKQRLFFAGLAGLGRMAPDDVERAAQALDVPIGAENSWTRALNVAVRRRQPGTVLLLAAVGMQTPGWDGVPPAALYRIVAALRAVGLNGEARMIAAEALTRA